VVLAFDNALVGVLNNAMASFDGVGSGAGGRVDVQPVIADITALIQNIDSQEALVQKARARSGGQVLLGVINGKKSFLNQKALTKIDQTVFQAMQDEEGADDVATSHSVGPFTLHARASVESDIPYVQSAVNAIAEWAPSKIIEGGTAARNGFTAALGGAATPQGAVAYVAITQITFALANGVESGSKQIFTSDPSLRVGSENLAAVFLADSYTGGSASRILNSYQQAKRAP
jgi:hypothetical protein